mgnify:CR=1 FL=1
MSIYSGKKFSCEKNLCKPSTFLSEVSNYSRRLFEKSLAKYPRKLAVTFQYIWGFNKFFLENLYFHSQMSIYSEGNLFKRLYFEISCPWIYREKKFSTHPELLDFRVLVNIERSYLRIRSSEKISKYFQEKDEV